LLLAVRMKLPEGAMQIRFELDDIVPSVALLPQAFAHTPHPEVHGMRVSQLPR